ncbi:NADH-ubiquinone oxidoreductase-F iron-sulfur binding region domain-containing protein [Candidatus Nitrotoga sp. M5]|uniref:NADH-ubiquinone oxidoreductase-F iron-sulfur binding region domain-containing protein n=1 Tax=Candidatus Nitrotoga sp. M5 TaxID=2890409 RepID=UPI001EF6012E|nr:NADH-ubiquinone oxidoreductase-F iron-sulfur binding region domain-containing protein [Candidatus Nitrotoga sp. M5]
MNSSNMTGLLRSVISRAYAESPNVLHVLYALQRQFLHISDEAVREVASHLELPTSQVDAVIEFYSFFHRIPRGRYDILFSNCTSCGYMAGGVNLMAVLGRQLEIVAGHTRGDGLVSMDQTSCIGMCDHGAALLVNGIPIVSLDVAMITRIAALVEAAMPLEDWPAEWFHVEDNIRVNGLLLKDDLPEDISLRAIFAHGAAGTLSEIIHSGLRGRGGAGFSTGMKWQLCREAQGDAHYIVCNADEGEPGTFKDRVLLHSYADRLFEGMTVCAFAIGAKQGYLYLRGEYRYLLPHLQTVLSRRRELGLLGGDILGQPGFSFDIDIVVGAGAYICGEESALIESLEGKRGIPRVRPPFPVTHGYLGQPTVVNNVETFIAAVHILRRGSAWFKAVGTEKSAGSKILSVSGDCAAPGIYEYPFGVTIRQVLDDCGAKNAQAVQVSGPSGTLINSAEFDRKLGFDDLSTGGSLMIFNQARDLLAVIVNFAHFFAHESCGFCTPCRVGTVLLKNGLDKIAGGHGTRYDLDEMQRIAALVKYRSHCGLGQTAANPILDGLQRFPQAFEQRLVHRDYEPHFDLDAALEEARQVSHRDDTAAHIE